MFRDTPLSQAELKDLAAASPVAVDALARLYQAYQESRTTTSMLAERLASDPNAENPEALLALEEVRDFINQQGNHFGALDSAAEELYAEAVGEHDEPYLALRARLQANHQVSTRVAPVEVMENTLRRFDRHRQTIFLSELLDQPGRSFQLAYQLAYFEQMPEIENIIRASGLENDNARTVARISLANYFAAAVLMPYGLFLKTAENNQYDITLLGRRFGTSFEQVCHRLTPYNARLHVAFRFFSSVSTMPAIFPSGFLLPVFTLHASVAPAHVGMYMMHSAFRAKYPPRLCRWKMPRAIFQLRVRSAATIRVLACPTTSSPSGWAARSAMPSVWFIHAASISTWKRATRRSG